MLLLVTRMSKELTSYGVNSFFNVPVLYLNYLEEKKMKSLLRLFTVIVVLTLLVACGDEDSTNSSQQKEGQNSASEQSEQNEQSIVHITLSEDKEAKVLEEKDVKIEDGDILLDVMKENFDVEVQEGGFISSINGINDDEGTLKKAWMFYVNGEMAMVGAGEVELKDGDEILFDFQSWE